jgi:phage shock protein PspC (stress-responsive transcriptional regulator)
MSLIRLAIVVLALIGAVGLALSNPTMDDYLQFVERELGRAIDRMDQHTPSREQQLIRDVFRSQSKKLIAGVVRPATVRHNWGLASQYETRVADTKVVVLGIGGQFVPIKGLEEATLKIGRMVF